ncbi:hypothetical protein [Clostridium tetani]|nr:hypothetical protein [Clostridium tetani]
MWTSIGERKVNAGVCKDSKGNMESDATLRDTESITLKEDLKINFKM